ncbi:hypothetical protein EB796_003401 [Bugula neritina]|uniref:Uncharacterized protein n=1 Tax=Bugula neritina TaxID=10212 RepID=A0A7J7KHZ2_BUGNE|nr:hypothetical protein EB796_003401 [Bugula neritina]
MVLLIDSTAPGPKALKPKAGQASVPVELTKPNLGNVTIKSFLLLLLPTEDKVKRSVAVPCDEDFVRNATPCPSTTGSCCATAELTEQYVGNRIVFNVGDGDTYGKYENTKLEAEKTYDFYVAVTVDVQEDKLLVHIGDAIAIQAPETAMKAPVTPVSPPTGAVAGGVSGGVIAVVIVIIIVVILLKR